MLPLNQDTIAAISTPPGTGGVAVLRLSGPQALDAITPLFSSSDRLKPRYAVFGKLSHADLGTDDFDDCIVTYFKEPQSFTGEDVVEISIHGGSYLQHKLLEVLLCAPGVRPAGAGEFTFRAFLRGKLDLSRAEAIADLIHAKDQASHRNARQQLRGGLRDLVEEMSKDLLNVIILIEAELDFSDQEIEFTPPEKLLEPIQDLIDLTRSLLDTYFYGRRLEEGFRVPLVGAPNSGKSSLFNLLVGESRAIVTNQAGTTRDTIEKTILIAGHSVLLIDTAGLRDSEDTAERSGVQRSKDEIKQADLVLLVQAPDTNTSKRPKLINTNQIVVFNKVDLVSSLPKNKDVYLSCVTKKGLADLKDQIYTHIINMKHPGVRGVILNNERHRSVFLRFLDQLSNSLVAITENRGLEYIASDLRLSLDVLGEITGKTTPDDILDQIFSGFCVGK